jgi:hypothetical protein
LATPSTSRTSVDPAGRTKITSARRWKDCIRTVDNADAYFGWDVDDDDDDDDDPDSDEECGSEGARRVGNESSRVEEEDDGVTYGEAD